MKYIDAPGPTENAGPGAFHAVLEKPEKNTPVLAVETVRYPAGELYRIGAKN